MGKAASWLAVALLLWPWTGLWRYVIVPVARYGIAAPAVWLYGAVLTPLGLGTAWSLGKVWQGTARVLAQVWRGIAATGRGVGIAVTWLVMTLLVAPVSWAYRRILVPIGRETAAAFEVAWRVAGYVSRAVGRALATITWYLIGAPASWAYRAVCAPVGHFVRDSVWAPAQPRRRRGGPGDPRGPRVRPGNRASGAPRRLAGTGRLHGRRTVPGTAGGPGAYSG